MNAFPRSLANEPRFLEPLFEDTDEANVETKAAVARVWERLGSIADTLSKLDGWAGDHNVRAVAGEAEHPTADEIEALMERFDNVDADLTLLWVAAQKVAA